MWGARQWSPPPRWNAQSPASLKWLDKPGPWTLASSKESTEGFLRQRRQSSSSSDHFQPRFSRRGSKQSGEGQRNKNRSWKVRRGRSDSRHLGRFALGGQKIEGEADLCTAVSPLCVFDLESLKINEQGFFPPFYTHHSLHSAACVQT